MEVFVVLHGEAMCGDVEEIDVVGVYADVDAVVATIAGQSKESEVDVGACIRPTLASSVGEEGDMAVFPHNNWAYEWWVVHHRHVKGTEDGGMTKASR